MTDLKTELLSNFITILIALVAGMIAIYQVKANIISDARVKWIETLRETISLYCMEVDKCVVIISNLANERKSNMDKNVDEIFGPYYEKISTSAQEILKLKSKIQLYLNSDDKIHRDIEDLLDLNDILIRTKVGCQDEIQTNMEKIILLSKVIFKTEWNKSKRIFKM